MVEAGTEALLRVCEERGARILVADDEESVRRVLVRFLRAEGYECAGAPDGVSALQLLLKEAFDLVIADIMMPGLSGMALLRETVDRALGAAVLMLTGLHDRRLAASAVKMGAFGYIVKPFDRRQVLTSVAGALEQRRLARIREEYERLLERGFPARAVRPAEHGEGIEARLSYVVEHREVETVAHIRRVGLYAAHLAQVRGWDGRAVEYLRLAAPVHDIGKVTVPGRILLKRGRLTWREFEAVKRHAAAGARLLKGRDVPLVRMAVEVARSHHERWDGAGYPDGLAGDAIPEAARLVAIADVYDVLTGGGYRSAFPEPEALGIMSAEREARFDPDIFDSFVEELPAFHRIGKVSYSLSSRPLLA